MNKPIQFLFILSLSVMLLACGKDANHQNKSHAYDYRDERHQDFYSRYMRKTQQDYLIIESKNIREKLKLNDVPDEVLARMDVSRTEPTEKIIPKINQLSNRAEILAFFNRNGGTFKECVVEDQEEHFFCIEDEKLGLSSRKYIYIPNESIKLKHIDQPIKMKCSMFQDRKSCSIIDRFNYPYNARLTIHFTDIQNFFYIIPYIEQHFYETTGEHVLENAPPSHASAAQ
ncbi:MAG TPA: hypothetical protein PK856_06690 [Vitreoscilla sp.]|nr:hypothetical protein [Vitreoscilla sp.]